MKTQRAAVAALELGMDMIAQMKISGPNPWKRILSLMISSLKESWVSYAKFLRVVDVGEKEVSGLPHEGELLGDGVYASLGPY